LALISLDQKHSALPNNGALRRQ